MEKLKHVFKPTEEVMEESKAQANPDRDQGQRADREAASSKACFVRSCERACQDTQSEPDRGRIEEVAQNLREDPSLAHEVWPTFVKLLNSKEPTQRWLAVVTLREVLRTCPTTLPHEHVAEMHHGMKIMATAPVDQERVNEIGVHTTDRAEKARHTAEEMLADHELWHRLQHSHAPSHGPADA